MLLRKIGGETQGRLDFLLANSAGGGVARDGELDLGRLPGGFSPLLVDESHQAGPIEAGMRCSRFLLANRPPGYMHA